MGIMMFLILSILAAATTPSMAQFPSFFPFPQFMPQQVPRFPWQPFVGGPGSLPPWLRPQEETSPNTEEVSDQIPMVGGVDSLPPWLKPQEEESPNTEDTVSEEFPIVGGVDSLLPWLRPDTSKLTSSRFIDNTGESEEDTKTEAATEDTKQSFEEYLKLCATLGIAPISSGSYTQPGYYGGAYTSPYTSSGTYSNYGGSSNYPYSTGYTGNTGYTGYTGYSGNTGYAGNTGYNGYPSYNYPTNTGYTYYSG